MMLLAGAAADDDAAAANGTTASTRPLPEAIPPPKSPSPRSSADLFASNSAAAPMGRGASGGRRRLSELQWQQLGSDIDGAGEYFGGSVSLSSDGSRVAIGKPGYGGRTGTVRMFEFSSDSWTQLGTVIDGEATGEEVQKWSDEANTLMEEIEKKKRKLEAVAAKQKKEAEARARSRTPPPGRG